MRLILLFTIGFLIAGCSKPSEEIIDLTMDITGEYQGSYSSDLDDIPNDFKVTVVKIDNDTVEILPSDGDSFLEVTVDLMFSSSSESIIINQPDQQYDTTTNFNISDSTKLVLSIDPTGFDAVFDGVKL